MINHLGGEFSHYIDPSLADPIAVISDLRYVAEADPSEIMDAYWLDNYLGGFAEGIQAIIRSQFIAGYTPPAEQDPNINRLSYGVVSLAAPRRRSLLLVDNESSIYLQTDSDVLCTNTMRLPIGQSLSAAEVEDRGQVFASRRLSRYTWGERYYPLDEPPNLNVQNPDFAEAVEENTEIFMSYSHSGLTNYSDDPRTFVEFASIASAIARDMLFLSVDL